jgi:hypothetical protein
MEYQPDPATQDPVGFDHRQGRSRNGFRQALEAIHLKDREWFGALAKMSIDGCLSVISAAEIACWPSLSRGKDKKYS